MPENVSRVLITKLRPPISVAHAISRPRLLSRVSAKLLPKVVLVTAPAGFGKTTLLAQWSERMGRQAGWLSLDRGDQDPIGFLRYLTVALNSGGPAISSVTESFIEGRTTPDLDAISARITADLANLESDRILFLDDYQLAETPTINDLLTCLVERSPPWLHIVIASRTLPALPVARLKAYSALLEINASELKFNLAETESLLQRSHKLDLGPSDVRTLNERVEGWAVGLQLVSLYLKNSPDVRRSIEDLSGGIRDIADYLATEVIRRLPADLQEFLLKTSVLERMNARICNALLDHSNSQARLEQIEALGLFLVPLDATREWYRYHHLFRDFLLVQLKRNEPEIVGPLFRKASLWFDGEGYAEEAVNMAMDSGDFDYAAMLVESSAMRMIKNGHMPQVNRWIRRLPEQILDEQLRFPAYRCWALIHMGKCQQAEASLSRAEAAIERLCDGPQPIPSAEQERLRAELLTLRAIAAIMADDVDRAYELSRTTLPDRSDFAFFSGALSNVLGLCHIARGEFELALTAGESAGRLHHMGESSYGVCYSHCVRGLAYQAQGRLSAAFREFESGERLARMAAGPKSFNAAMPRVLKAVVHYERNELDQAMDILEQDLPLVEECAYIGIRTAAFLAMAGILGAREQTGAALRWLDQAISASSESIIERTRTLVNDEAVRLRLMAGDLTGARRFARHVGIDDPISFPAQWRRSPVYRMLTQCRLLIAEGHGQSAIDYLKKLAALAGDSGRTVRKLQILTLLALAHFKAGEREAASAVIGEILRSGTREGHIRSVVDQGRDVGAMFGQYARDAARTNSLPAGAATFLDDILAAVSPSRPARAPSAEGEVTGPTVVRVQGFEEVLTDQEIKVLRLLAGGASNGQIGADLHISVNTVRWHVGNILNKLQVENRTQAASAAYSFGLIS